MTHIIRYLAEHAEQRIELIQHPEKIPDAVEELLRRFSIISIGREVTRDVTYEGMAATQRRYGPLSDLRGWLGRITISRVTGS